MRIEHSLHIAAPVADVWALTIDVEAWPALTPTITSVRREDDGPFGVGARARIKQPGQKERSWTVTEFDTDRRFAWATKAMGMTMTGGHTLAPDADGTRNTLTVDLEGRFAPILGRLIAGPIAKAIATENEGFKTAAEATPAA